MNIKIYILFLMFSFSFGLIGQNDNISNRKQYIIQFQKAKELINSKSYKSAKLILNGLLNRSDLDIIGCNTKSEISHQDGICYYFSNEKLKALEIWKDQTIPLRNSCESVDDKGIAQTYYNIGYLYSEFNDYNNALSYINKALSIIDSANLLNDIKYADWYLNQYHNSRQLGDLISSEGYAFNTISILNKINKSKSKTAAKTYYRLARIFIDKDEFILAQKYLDFSNDILDRSNSKYLSMLYRSYAILQLKKQNYIESITWSNKALGFTKENKINNKIWLARIYETLGLATSYNGDHRKSLLYFNKTLKLRLEEKAKKTGLSLIYENIAGVYGRLEKFDSALFYINLSIDILHNHKVKTKNIKYEDLENNDFRKSDMIRKLQMRGKFLTRKFKKDNNLESLYEAEKCFAEADSFVYLMRRDILNKDSKIIFGTALDTVYKYAIDNVYTLWKETGEKKYLERAYYYTAENKAVVFGETKEELNAVWEILNPELRKRYLSILDELNTNLYQKQYAVIKNDTLAYQKLNTQYILLSSQKEKLFEKIKSENPEFYLRIYGLLKPRSVKDLQTNLENNNAIVEYYIDNSILYTFVISKNDFHVNKMTFNFDLDSFFQISNYKLTDFEYSDIIKEMCEDLYPILFPKSVVKFLEKQNIDRLIVIRDKNMNLITFAPILFKENSKQKYLINKYAFSYAFNNKYIWSFSDNVQKKPYEFGGFATNYDRKSLKEINKDTLYWDQNLEPLEQSIEEVSSISGMFKSKTWIGDNSTTNNFKKNAHNFDIIHLSLHSIIASKNNEQNAMIFQKTAESKSFILKSSDLIGLRLNNSLSVLSSCYTSDGSVIKGEGIKSLARSFAIAGSPAIVASQWQAYEGQTRHVLSLFYQNLKKGYTKDVAMQKAQLEFIENVSEEFSAPANWSNLILIGDAKKIEFDFNFNFDTRTFFIIAMVLISLFIVFLFYAKFFYEPDY